MRLLRIKKDGELSLTEFRRGQFPPYAILSHTWGTEEVSFQDLEQGIAKSRAGYRKLDFCAQQARRDDLSFLWVDTCCIDKSSSAELSEAINSMFRWYQRAEKCYVYLADVSINDSDPIDTAFQQSRWFTRCWTLQELLAPKSVHFFSREGKCLGDKVSFAQEIHSTTRIPIQALQGTHLSQFSVDERVSWAEHRNSSREEDAVYSLLGLLGVHMALIYGEGRENALFRLQEEIKKDRSRLWGQKDRMRDLVPTFQRLVRENVLSHPAHIFTTIETSTKIDEIPDTESDSESDIDSIFSAGKDSISSASTMSLNSTQTLGIREVARALLSKDDLNALYNTAVRSVAPRKTRAHIRGFLQEYGQNLLQEASRGSIEIQAAKFVQELAGRITDEICWSITGFERGSGPSDHETAVNLESWLSALQPLSIDVEAGERSSGREAGNNVMFEDDDSDDEADSDLPFPNIEKVKDFLLNSEAFNIHVVAMRTWLKVDRDQRTDIEPPAGNLPDPANARNNNEEASLGSASSTVDGQQMKSVRESATDVEASCQQETAQELNSMLILRRNLDSVADLISCLLNFWGVSFLFYDLVELFVPRIQPGYKRLRWRCSCNAVLWGDFPVDDEHALDQLKRELSRRGVRPTRQVPLDVTTMPQPPADSETVVSGSSHLRSMHSTSPPPDLGGIPLPISSSHATTNVSNTLSGSVHIVDIAFSPRYFEVCVNIGNYATDHHEIDILRVSSDSELFELIWDKYNSSRGVGLRRLFLRPRSVDFVMFSVSRRTEYGAGIHKKPDEFPPQVELDEKRYHYLCPKIRMPVNIFLHYLHRARWNIWGEHTEDTWLQRLPKKLNEGVLAKVQQDATQQQGGEQVTLDPSLAFGWGVHILDGPNHAVLGLLLSIGVVVSFVVSGMVVGIAKTQEQGFGIGNFLLAIIASIMTAVYFQLQD